MTNYHKFFFAIIGCPVGAQFSHMMMRFYISYLNDDVKTLFDIYRVLLGDLKQIIKSLNNISPGHENILMSAFKMHFYILGETVLSLCNKTLNQGIFPESLKRARMNPLYKQGDRKLN